MWVAVLVASMGTFSPPSECAPVSARAANNVWERAKAPLLARYCDALASGTAKLANPTHIATDVVELANEAEAALPGRAPPQVLLGRALARLGKYDLAREALATARARDPASLDDPLALLCWARMLAYAGQVSGALEAYRALLPRASSLSLAERGVAYVGAGMVAMSTGAKGLEEAVSIFREARKNSQDVVLRVAGLALALALDRAGEREEAVLILRERPIDNPGALLNEPAAIEALGPASASEGSALMALALEMTDPVAARSAWGNFLEGPGQSGPWAEHARLHASRRSDGRRGP